MILWSSLCFLVEKASVDKLLQEEFDVAQLRVLDPQRLEHPDVPVLHSEEHGTEMLHVCPMQVEFFPEVLYCFRL